MKMSWTACFVLIGIIAMGIWDLCIVSIYGTSSTVSDFLIRHGFKSPPMVFAFGYAAGHIFGCMSLDISKADEQELDRICAERNKK